jgi:NAD(P)-dependent dehydrogenase (short-subunit alcohol dehydrogenase family)
MKKILITGGSKGIGKELVKQFCKKGHDVLFTYQNSKEDADKLVEELSSDEKNSVQAYQCDMSNEKDVRQLFIGKKEFFKDLDVLINNAGIRDSKNSKQPKPFVMTPSIDWWEVMHNNVNCVINPTRAILPHMIKRKSGRIINITSISGIKGNPGQSAYASSKAAITCFSKSINKEIAGLGIIINCVAPSFIETDMTENISDKYMEQRLQGTLLKRMGKTEEMSNLVIYMALEAPDFLINQEIVFDGGIG